VHLQEGSESQRDRSTTTTTGDPSRAKAELTDFGTLFENDDADVLAALLGELLELDGGTEAGRPCADDADVALVLDALDALDLDVLVEGLGLAGCGRRVECARMGGRDAGGGAGGGDRRSGARAGRGGRRRGRGGGEARCRGGEAAGR